MKPIAAFFVTVLALGLPMVASASLLDCGFPKDPIASYGNIHSKSPYLYQIELSDNGDAFLIIESEGKDPIKTKMSKVTYPNDNTTTYFHDNVGVLINQSGVHLNESQWGGKAYVALCTAE